MRNIYIQLISLASYTSFKDKLSQFIVLIGALRATYS